MNSLKRTARIAGVQYLFVAITGAFSIMYVPSTLIVLGDASATVSNIMTSELLFRLGFVSGLVSNVLFLLLVLTLYKLLKGVNKQQASLMVVLVVTAVSIAFLAMLNQSAALHLLSGADYLKAFEQDQLHAQVLLFLNLYNRGLHIAAIFWGLWLLPLGLLVIKSGFIPRLLGILLIIGGFGYLIASFAYFLFPDYAALTARVTTTPSAIAELSMILWLLIKGVSPSH